MKHMRLGISKISAAVLSSELRIKAQDSTHSFLLLEGSFDLRFWENRLNSVVVRPVECGGKSMLLETMTLVRGGDLEPRVMGLVDADFDRLMGNLPRDRLVLTDQNDLEMTLFLLQYDQQAQTFLDRLLASSVDPQKKTVFEKEQACSVMEFVRRIASQYGVLRFLNEREDWGLNFGELAILNTDWFDQTALHLNLGTLHQAVLAKMPSRPELDLVAKIDECRQFGWLDDWSLVQGHDFIKVLSVAVNSQKLRRDTGHLQWSENSLHRDMLLMHWQDIQTCAMVNQLRGFNANQNQDLFSHLADG